MLILVFRGDKFLPEFVDWCDSDKCFDYVIHKRYIDDNFGKNWDPLMKGETNTTFTTFYPYNIRFSDSTM